MAIVGNGDIASVIPHSEEKLYFASVVRNSQETRESEYAREISLLLKQPKNAHLVYFGSMSIFYSDTRYATHKKTMEHIIKAHFPLYAIVRLGNIDWGRNPNTLINYLKIHPEAELKDEYRYIISKDEFLYWLEMIPDFPVEMNCPGRRMKVKEIWEQYVKQ